MAHLLAMRFSALGDVAMTVPVVRSFALAYPQHEVTLMSRPMAAPLFEGLPANVHFRPVKVSDYKGVNGLVRLYHELESEGYDGVADLHDVLRTMLLRLRLRAGGRPSDHIRKGHKEKHRLTSAKHRDLKPLRTSVQRYADVFARLGYPFEVDLQPLKPAGFSPLPPKSEACWIGIAPFAQHKGKIYPLEQMKEVIRLLAKGNDTSKADGDRSVFLFGAGEQEKAWCEACAREINAETGCDHVTSLVGRYTIREELAVMSQLDAMVCMDSANMHLASLVGTRTVTLWGATHPYAGFAALQRPGSQNLQLDLTCRPCSVFGNKACKNKEPYACLRGITPQSVVQAVEKVAGKTESCE